MVNPCISQNSEIPTTMHWNTIGFWKIKTQKNQKKKNNCSINTAIKCFIIEDIMQQERVTFTIDIWDQGINAIFLRKHGYLYKSEKYMPRDEKLDGNTIKNVYGMIYTLKTDEEIQAPDLKKMIQRKKGFTLERAITEILTAIKDVGGYDVNYRGNKYSITPTNPEQVLRNFKIMRNLTQTIPLVQKTKEQKQRTADFIEKRKTDRQRKAILKNLDKAKEEGNNRNIPFYTKQLEKHDNLQRYNARQKAEEKADKATTAMREPRWNPHQTVPNDRKRWNNPGGKKGYVRGSGTYRGNRRSGSGPYGGNRRGGKKGYGGGKGRHLFEELKF